MRTCGQLEHLSRPPLRARLRSYAARRAHPTYRPSQNNTTLKKREKREREGTELKDGVEGRRERERGGGGERRCEQGADTHKVACFSSKIACCLRRPFGIQQASSQLILNAHVTQTMSRPHAHRSPRKQRARTRACTEHRAAPPSVARGRRPQHALRDEFPRWFECTSNSTGKKCRKKGQDARSDDAQAGARKGKGSSAGKGARARRDVRAHDVDGAPEENRMQMKSRELLLEPSRTFFFLLSSSRTF